MEEMDHSEYSLVDIIVVSTSFGNKTFVNSCAQTKSTRFFCSSPFIAAANDVNDEFMEQDIVLLSACRSRLDQNGILFIDAWTQTPTTGFLYLEAGASEFSDEETLCEDTKNVAKENDPQDYISFLFQKITELTEKIIPRLKLNSIFKFFSMGFAVGLRFSIGMYNQIRLFF